MHRVMVVLKGSMRSNTQLGIKIRNGQKAAQCIFLESPNPCLILSDDIGQAGRGNTAIRNTDTLTYTKSNREEAIACALRVALETTASQQARTMHGNDPDDNEYMMQSVNEPVQARENKHLTSPCKLVQNSTHPTESEIPTLPIGRVNSCQPKHMSMTKDFIIQATGYHKSDLLLKHFHTISNNTVSITSIDKNPTIKKVESATLHSNRRNTTPSNTEKLSPGEVYNMDIAYGPTVGIGGIKYALILIDRKTKHKLI